MAMGPGMRTLADSFTSAISHAFLYVTKNHERQRALAAVLHARLFFLFLFFPNSYLTTSLSHPIAPPSLVASLHAGPAITRRVGRLPLPPEDTQTPHQWRRRDDGDVSAVTVLQCHGSGGDCDAMHGSSPPDLLPVCLYDRSRV